MKTIELSDFEKRCPSCPWAIYFIYPKDGEPVVVKGMSKDVVQYVREHYPVALVRYTFWKDGVSRGHWMFTNSNHPIRYHEPGRFVMRDGRRWKVMIGDRTYSFRRLPKRWIPEFD